jgi:hypothetical protein
MALEGQGLSGIAGERGLLGELGAQPIKTLVESLARGGASGLDMPGALAKSVELELVGCLGGREGVREILGSEWELWGQRGSWFDIQTRKLSLLTARRKKIYRSNRIELFRNLFVGQD